MGPHDEATPDEAAPDVRSAPEPCPLAFRRLVEATRPELHARARAICRDDALAEDAVQETFARAWRALPGLEEGSNLPAWLHRVIVNASIDQLRRHGREVRRATAVAEATGPDGAVVPDPSVAVDDRLAMASALGTLVPTHRTALVMRDFEGREYGEIASAEGTSEVNVRARVARARRAMRLQLHAAGVRRISIAALALGLLLLLLIAWFTTRVDVAAIERPLPGTGAELDRGATGAGSDRDPAGSTGPSRGGSGATGSSDRRDERRGGQREPTATTRSNGSGSGPATGAGTLDETPGAAPDTGPATGQEGSTRGSSPSGSRPLDPALVEEPAGPSGVEGRRPTEPPPNPTTTTTTSDMPVAGAMGTLTGSYRALGGLAAASKLEGEGALVLPKGTPVELPAVGLRELTIDPTGPFSAVLELPIGAKALTLHVQGNVTLTRLRVRLLGRAELPPERGAEPVEVVVDITVTVVPGKAG